MPCRRISSWLPFFARAFFSILQLLLLLLLLVLHEPVHDGLIISVLLKAIHTYLSIARFFRIRSPLALLRLQPITLSKSVVLCTPTIFFRFLFASCLYRGLMHIPVTFNLALRFILLSEKLCVYLRARTNTGQMKILQVYRQCNIYSTRFHISHANSKTLI